MIFVYALQRDKFLVVKTFYRFLQIRNMYTFFFIIIRTKFIRTQAFGHPEIKNMIRTQGFPQQ